MANDGLIEPETAQAPPAQRVTLAAPDAAMVMRAVMRAVSTRAQAVLCVTMVFALACWAMAAPTLLRVLIAAGFAVFSLCAQAVLAWGEK